MAEWIATFGRCELEVAWQQSIYESLVRAIAHQQLHGKAAKAVLQRLCDAFPAETFPSAAALAGATTEQLRAVGFSQSKAKAIQGVATAVLNQTIVDRNAADRLSNEEIIAQLTVLRGVGKWTVEMLLIFTLGRLDVMPVDDFGVRSGFQQIYHLPSLVKKADLRERTTSWQPYRSVGAWYLWRYADYCRSQRQVEAVRH